MQNKKLWLAIGAVLLVNLGTIVVLLAVKSKAEGRLVKATGFLRELGDQYIDYVVEVHDTIPLLTSIQVTHAIPVDIAMTIDDSVLITANVPVKDTISVPVNLMIDQQIGVDNPVMIPGIVTVQLDTKIPINQKFKMPVGKKGKGMKIPIMAEIPLNQAVGITFNDSMRINTKIPVKFPLNEMLRVPIELNVPMNQEIPLRLPLKQMATVGFPTAMPVNGKVPIVLKVPVHIPLNKTPIKTYLDKTADELDDMLSF